MHFQSGQYSLSKKFTDEAEHIKKGGTISASPILSINAEVTCAYSFDQNKDFYQISLSEVYPGQTPWNGSQKVKRSGLYYDKYGGYGLDYIDIYLSDLQTRDGVTLESLTSVAPFDPDRFYAGEDTQLDRAAAFIHSGR